MKLKKCIDACTKSGKKVSIDLTANDRYDWNSNLIEDGIVKHALVVGGIDSRPQIDVGESISSVSLFNITNKYEMRKCWSEFSDLAKCNSNLINGLKKFLLKFGLSCNDISIGIGYDQLCNLTSSDELSLIEYYAWKSLLTEDNALLLLAFPDAFLDFKSARILADDLNSLDVQTIMFTNNVTLLDNDITRPDCCFIATNDSVKSFDKSTDREIRQAHNLEKMYVNGVFG